MSKQLTQLYSQKRIAREQDDDNKLKLIDQAIDELREQKRLARDEDWILGQREIREREKAEQERINAIMAAEKAEKARIAQELAAKEAFLEK